MIRSMTGFGRAYKKQDTREITIEVKSVNHKFLDLRFKTPAALAFLEDALKSIISNEISRGHVEVFVSYRNFGEDAVSVDVNNGLLGQYLKTVKEAAERFSIPFDLTASSIVRIPGVLTVCDAGEDSDAVLELARDAMAEAVGELYGMRCREGERLYKDISEKISAICAVHEKMVERAPEVAMSYKKRLTERVEQILPETEIDTARLATEIAIFAEKASIDEELTRIISHTVELRNILDSDEPVGRRMDFIIQEINRELTTAGSKANDEQLAKLVILGKSELEKLREQVQNIE